jgi:hypothetical protein
MYCEVKELEGEDGPGMALNFPAGPFMRGLADAYRDELGAEAVAAMERVACILDERFAAGAEA